MAGTLQEGEAQWAQSRNTAQGRCCVDITTKSER
jgi:hypothetical protein